MLLMLLMQQWCTLAAASTTDKQYNLSTYHKGRIINQNSAEEVAIVRVSMLQSHANTALLGIFYAF
jgi:hypothetical protein